MLMCSRHCITQNVGSGCNTWAEILYYLVTEQFSLNGYDSYAHIFSLLCYLAIQLTITPIALGYTPLSLLPSTLAEAVAPLMCRYAFGNFVTKQSGMKVSACYHQMLFSLLVTDKIIQAVLYVTLRCSHHWVTEHVGLNCNVFCVQVFFTLQCNRVRWLKL
jgi:hypothetical protein